MLLRQAQVGISSKKGPPKCGFPANRLPRLQVRNSRAFLGETTGATICCRPNVAARAHLGIHAFPLALGGSGRIVLYFYPRWTRGNAPGGSGKGRMRRSQARRAAARRRPAALPATISFSRRVRRVFRVGNGRRARPTKRPGSRPAMRRTQPDARFTAKNHVSPLSTEGIFAQKGMLFWFIGFALRLILLLF